MEVNVKMYHCREPMLRRTDPPGWFCAECKAFEADTVKMRQRIIPRDEFDTDLSDKRVIAMMVSCAIIGAGIIVLWALFFGR